MPPAKIALIGAASTSFGLGMLQDLVAHASDLADATIALADLDTAGLETMHAAAERLGEAAGASLRFTASRDLDTALTGAQFVITSVSVDRLATWRLDWEIPRRYGFRQVLGENGGPGGLGHTLRSVDVMMRIARTIQEAAPDAWLLNFTNPMSRVCLALNRATKLKTVGLCHQIGAAYRTLGVVMGHAEDMEQARAQVGMLEARYDVRAAGINHLTFIYHIHDSELGRDIYPEFVSRLAAMPPAFEPLARRIHAAFGLYPATGDNHAGEYFSFAYETSSETGYDFAGRAAEGQALRARLRAMLSGELDPGEFLGRTSGERAIPIIVALLHNRNQFERALNLPNQGCLPGLPDWAVVEIPGLVGAAGVAGLHVPPLPPGITAVLAQQIAVQDRAVDAALHGSRHDALQALLLDPLVTSYANAEAMLDELLAVHAPYLPQFAP